MKLSNITPILETWEEQQAEPVQEIDETCNEIPERGDTIRTNKSSMDGKVESVNGSGEVFFRIADGRLMKTHLNNVTVVEKLADEDSEIMEDEELMELSNELLTKYKTAATDSAGAADALGDIKTGNKRFSGVVKATNKQFANDAKKAVAAIKEDEVEEGSMGGINRSRPAQDVSYEHVLDRNPETEHSKVVGETFEERLNHFLEADDPFKKILNKQHKEVKKIEEKDYNGWKIRYQLVPSKPGAPVQWMAWHGRSGPENAHRGQSPTPQKAWDDATAWINSGGGAKKSSSKNITIDFNTDFSKQFAPNNETFYATIDDGYLLFSSEQHVGLKVSVKRHSDRYIFQSITLTPKEANAAGLVPHARYTLGSPEDYSPGIKMFPIQFQGTTAHSGDKLRMGTPGFTAATERGSELDERLDPWHGYTPDDKKANALAKAPKSSMQGTGQIPFSQLVQDTVREQGVKWAFEYYCIKHGLPPRQFRIFAGI